MPRQQRRSAPRPSVQQQTRQAHTVPARQQAPPQQPPQQPPQHAMTQPPPASVAHPAAPSQGPGLFAQMATTAAGVAVGSAVGHTMAAGVSSLFSGSGSSEEQHQPQQQQQYQQPPQQVYQQQQPGAVSCEADAQAFTKCLQANNNDVTACQWYLDSLKACQQMAANY